MSPGFISRGHMSILYHIKKDRILQLSSILSQRVYYRFFQMDITTLIQSWVNAVIEVTQNNFNNYFFITFKGIQMELTASQWRSISTLLKKLDTNILLGQFSQLGVQPNVTKTLINNYTKMLYNTNLI